MAEELNLEDELLGLLNRDPFVSFTISLTSGERHEIKDPGQLAVGNSVVTFAQYRNGRTYFRKNQIVSIHAPDL